MMMNKVKQNNPSNCVMNNFKLIVQLVLMTIFILTVNSEAYAADARINHFRILSSEPNQSIAIEATVEGGNSLPVTARVYYRNLPNDPFAFEGLSITSRNISGSIPAEAVKQIGLEYYLSVILENDVILTYPEGAPFQLQPLSVNVSPLATVASELRTVIISPDPDSNIKLGETLIAISILPGQVPVDATSLRITIDGKDITKKAFVSVDMVSIVLSNLKAGAHKVHLYSTSGGKKMTLAKWSFTVRSEKEVKKWDTPIHAKTDVGFSYEEIHGETRDISYLNTRLNGNLNKLYWSSRLYFTSLENKNIQPQHRFNLALKYGGQRLNVGDVRPRFSEFSLWGVRTRGGEISFKSNYFNLAFAGGQVRSSIDGSKFITIITDPFTGDTLKTSDGSQDSTRTNIRLGTYQRNLTAIKPGFVFGKGVVLSLNLVKVKDDMNSIDFGTRPKDNLVMGYDLKITSPSRRFQLSTETALSMYNSDISGGAMTDAIDFEDLIVVNQYFEPLPNDSSILNSDSSTSGDLMEVVIKEMVASSMAHRSTLMLNYFRNELRVGYKTIGNSFKSLASPTVLTDVVGISIEDRLRLLNNRVYLNVGYEDYQNNVNGRAATTMDRNIMRGGISYYTPPEYPNANFTLRSYDRENDGEVTVTRLVTGDEVVVDKRIKHNASSYTFGIDQSFEFAEFRHLASAMFTSNIGSDKINSALDTEINTFNLNLTSKRRTRLETRIGISNSTQKSLGGDSDLSYNTISLSGRYMVMIKSLWVKGGINSSTASGGVTNVSPAPSNSSSNDSTVTASNVQFDRLQISAGLEYRYNQHHNLNINAYWYGQTDDGSTEYYSGRKEPNTNTVSGKDDLVARVNYSYSF